MWMNENVYDSSIHEAALKYGVPFEFVKAIIGKESGFVVNARRAEPAYKCPLTGKVGDASIGLMQILLCTAMGEGFRGTEAQLFDPHTNIEYGTKYLAGQLARASGRIDSAASAYNGGWNPNIGFGAPVTRTGITVCLARDTVTGKCINSRTVPIGEYANQSYVDKVLQYYQYFRGKSATGGMSPPLSVAHHDDTESENVGHLGGIIAGISRTQIQGEAVKQKSPFAIASGKKWVSWAGLAVAGLGLLCTVEHRAILDATVSSVWAARICGAVALLGSIVASLGKGLADQRQPRDNGYYVASGE